MSAPALTSVHRLLHSSAHRSRDGSVGARLELPDSPSFFSSITSNLVVEHYRNNLVQHCKCQVRTGSKLLVNAQKDAQHCVLLDLLESRVVKSSK